MKKSLILALCLLALIGTLDAQVQGGNSIAIDSSIGMRGGSMAESLSITSPYLSLGNRLIAIKLSGDASLAVGQEIGSGEILTSAFWSTRLGLTSKKEINDYIATSFDMGGVLLFPNAEISTSELLHFGVYVDIGFEVFLDSTKKQSFYISTGWQYMIDPLVADQYSGNDILGTGADISAGFRIRL